MRLDDGPVTRQDDLKLHDVSGAKVVRSDAVDSELGVVQRAKLPRSVNELLGCAHAYNLVHLQTPKRNDFQMPFGG